VLDRSLDDGAELAILLLLEADIARVDTILVERFGAGRMIRQELVADVVEVADDWHIEILFEKSLLDVRHGGCRLVAVDGDADDLGTGPRQRGDLLGGRIDIGRIRVGHRLHDDRGAAADRHAADPHADGLVPFRGP